MEEIREQLAHPAFRTGASMLVAYLLILGIFTILLFLIPYAIFTLT